MVRFNCISYVLCAAENPRLSVNHDVSQPYKFRADARPMTTAVDFKPSSRQSLQKVSFEKPVLETEKTMPYVSVPWCIHISGPLKTYCSKVRKSLTYTFAVRYTNEPFIGEM